MSFENLTKIAMAKSLSELAAEIDMTVEEFVAKAKEGAKLLTDMESEDG